MSRGEPEFDSQAFMERYAAGSPHMVAIGFEPVYVRQGRATMRLPYRPEIVGNPETGVVHGGAVTTLIDTVCGLAVLSALSPISPIVTVDLRIDYVRPATPEKPIMAQAECYKLTELIAFTRGTAYQDDPDDVVASAAGTFMILGGRKPERRQDRVVGGGGQ